MNTCFLVINYVGSIIYKIIWFILHYTYFILTKVEQVYINKEARIPLKKMKHFI